MALRNVVKMGDPVLSKKCRVVEKFDEKLSTLIDDMFETMYASNGVGLAAPQVGLLKRVVVMDCGDEPIELVNPEIPMTEGEQMESEGCLSVPGKVGMVKRPNVAKVRALDENMEEFEIEGEELLARALLHETDHLDGKLYVDLVEGELYNTEDLVEEE